MIQFFRKLLTWTLTSKSKKLIRDSHEFNGVLAHKLIDRKTFVEFGFPRHYHKDDLTVTEKFNKAKLRTTLELHTIYDDLSSVEVLLTSTKIMFIRCDGDGEWFETHGKFDVRSDHAFNELLTSHLIEFHFNRILNFSGNFNGEIVLSERFGNIMFLDNFMNSKLEHLINRFELGDGVMINEPWVENSGKDENFYNLLKNQVQSFYDRLSKFGYILSFNFEALPNKLSVLCKPDICSVIDSENIIIECDLSVFFEPTKVQVFKNPNYFVHKVIMVLVEQLLSAHYEKVYKKGLMFMTGALKIDVRNVSLDYAVNTAVNEIVDDTENIKLCGYGKALIDKEQLGKLKSDNLKNRIKDNNVYLGSIEKPTSMEPRVVMHYDKEIINLNNSDSKIDNLKNPPVSNRKLKQAQKKHEKFIEKNLIDVSKPNPKINFPEIVYNKHIDEIKEKFIIDVSDSAIDIIPEIPMDKPSENVELIYVDGNGTIDESLSRMESLSIKPEIDLSEFKTEPVFIPIEQLVTDVNNPLNEHLLLKVPHIENPTDEQKTAVGNYMENWHKSIEKSKENDLSETKNGPNLISMDMGKLSTDLTENDLSLGINVIERIQESIIKESGIPKRYFDRPDLESKSIQIQPDAPTERIETEINLNNEDKE